MTATGWPEMWTRSGNLIGVQHRRGSRSFGYAVFSPSGSRLATLATGLSTSVADQRYDDPVTGTFWYLTGNGDLLRTDGVATSAIASTRALGFTSVPYVGILRGGLVQLLSVSANWRQGQVILYPDGQQSVDDLPGTPRERSGGGIPDRARAVALRSSSAGLARVVAAIHP